jgi:hypothetical protein
MTARTVRTNGSIAFGAAEVRFATAATPRQITSSDRIFDAYHGFAQSTHDSSGHWISPVNSVKLDYKVADLAEG